MRTHAAVGSEAGPAIMEAWSLSSRIHEIPGHTLGGSVKGWGCRQRLVWRVATHTPSLVLGYLMRRSILNLSWLIWILDQSGGRHHTATWCSGRRPFSLIVTELKESSESALKLVGHSKSLLDRIIPVDEQTPDCTNGVRALNIW